MADAGDAKQVRRAVAEVVQEFATVDILVNNAGIGSRTRILDTSDEHLESVIRSSLFGTFRNNFV